MHSRKLVLVVAGIFLTSVARPMAPSDAVAARAHRLAGVRDWGYQIQGLEEDGAVEALMASPYELLVVEPTRTVRGSEDFDAAGLVDELHERGKLVLAYLDVGEAEDYRTYWGEDWVAPTDERRGEPSFLVRPDPDGWSGNFPVAYWDPRWRELMLHDPDGPLQKALDDGFDGAYLDWIEAYDDPVVRRLASVQNVDPAEMMVAFVGELRAAARLRDPDFLVVPQNAADLALDRPEYFDVIDGLAIEDLAFAGEADTEWGDAGSGDILQDPDYQAELLGSIALYRDAGLPIFCVDYAREPENTASARATAKRAGCVSFVSQTPLDRLPNADGSG